MNAILALPVSHSGLVFLLFPIYFHIKAAPLYLLLQPSADPSSVSPACLCPVSDIALWTPRRRTERWGAGLRGRASYI